MKTDEVAQVIAKLVFATANKNCEDDDSLFQNELKDFIEMARETLGGDEFKNYTAHINPFILILTEALIDYAVIDKLSNETLQKLKVLPVEGRFGVHFLLLHFTGRSLLKPDMTFWPNVLWRIKNVSKRLVERSESGITSEEILVFIKPLALSLVLQSLTKLGLA